VVKKDGHSADASDNMYFIPTVNLLGQLGQPDLYWEGAKFESQLIHWMLWLRRFSMVLCRLSAKCRKGTVMRHLTMFSVNGVPH